MDDQFTAEEELKEACLYRCSELSSDALLSPESLKPSTRNHSHAVKTDDTLIL